MSRRSDLIGARAKQWDKLRELQGQGSHLTRRAVEWLQHGGVLPESGYTEPIGFPACVPVAELPQEWVGAQDIHGYPRQPSLKPLPLNWCSVPDVRAMVRGWGQAYEGWKEKKSRPLRMPHCHNCAVRLDELLASFTAKQRKSA